MVARWPVPVTAEDVPTGYGITHVLVSGAGAGGTPAVLLPGGGATATAWAALAGLLSRSRPVVAVNLVGQPGLSTPGPRRPAPPMTSSAGWTSSSARWPPGRRC